ncbi:inositol monophosphatase family protein [Planctomicrobium piriforme]|uniref:Histidinol-phosphatase, inositol monophosphatase family n=1 Tax=Planctomicrobium piriforme TaxID=1576369 RepID=A0A1I3AQS3_9PLAN|nr:inositol monophosphatase family protein [Planctomicrobium piriforme]SFH52330.1 histidinol-phosphatase, inositol monophosphatase family [Planctomicrobium piriforme]
MADPAAVDERLRFALNASAQAERLVMSYFGDAALQVDLKDDLTPVTAADRGAEELLRRTLLGTFPHDSVLGEEFGETKGNSGFRWILDPVDGTKSFVHGVPLFGMLIGLQFEGENVAGICRLPAVREVIYASRGRGSWWQRGSAAAVPAQVTTATSLSDSLFCYTAVDGFEQIQRSDVLQKLSQVCRLSRGWGDCYGHMLVATGRADLMIDPLLAEWDACALIPIIEEAGGIFMDWTGRSTAVGGNGISLTPQIKSELQQIIRR